MGKRGESDLRGQTEPAVVGEGEQRHLPMSPARPPGSVRLIHRRRGPLRRVLASSARAEARRRARTTPRAFTGNRFFTTFSQPVFQRSDGVSCHRSAPPALIPPRATSLNLTRRGSVRPDRPSAAEQPAPPCTHFPSCTLLAGSPRPLSAGRSLLCTCISCTCFPGTVPCGASLRLPPNFSIPLRFHLVLLFPAFF